MRLVFTRCAGPRRPFCTEAGVAAAVAQALIGHDSEQIHNDYISVGRQALNDAVATLPTIL
jgi:hypothetical protein